MEYHLSIGGEKSGPFPNFAIIDRIRDGELSRADLTWKQGMPEWRPLGELDEFTDYWPPTEDEPMLEEPEVPHEEEVLNPQAPRPWLRFWARVLDYVWFFGGVAFALGMILRHSAQAWVEWAAQSYIPIEAFVMLLYVPLEAWCLAKFGKTPGRVLMRLEVQSTVDGGRPTYKQALIRSLHVYVKGLGCWLPLLSLFMMSWSRLQLLRDGSTSWDRACATTVISQPMQRWRFVVLGVIIALLVIMTTIGLMVRQAMQGQP